MTVVPLPRARYSTIQGTLALELALTEPDPVPDGMACPDHRLGPWVRQVVQAAVEVVGGQRPVSQLVRWVSPEVHRDLHRRAQLVAQASGQAAGVGHRTVIRPQVCSVHASTPAPGVLECAVRVRYGARSRALAVRFEQHHERWLCTALDWS